MFKNAKFIAPNLIFVEINGVPSYVPCCDDNCDFRDIVAAVDAGELVISPYTPPAAPQPPETSESAMIAHNATAQ